MKHGRARFLTGPLLAALLCAVPACDDPTDPAVPEPVEFDAVVQMLVLEGPHTWILVDQETDANYFPLNLPPEFQVEGAAVHVTGLRQRHYDVYFMDPLEILTITALE